MFFSIIKGDTRSLDYSSCLRSLVSGRSALVSRGSPYDPALRSTLSSITQRVHAPNNWVLKVLVVAIIVQVLAKYMIIEYLDP